MEGLNELEQAVLDKLLGGDHPILSALRVQAKRVRVVRRKCTGVGFFCDFDVPQDVPRLTQKTDFHFGDVTATVDGLTHGAGFVLFVRNGHLAVLEGYTYDEPWPQGLHNVALTYQREPRNLTFT